MVSVFVKRGLPRASGKRSYKTVQPCIESGLSHGWELLFFVVVFCLFAFFIMDAKRLVCLGFGLWRQAENFGRIRVLDSAP